MPPGHGITRQPNPIKKWQSNNHRTTGNFPAIPSDPDFARSTARPRIPARANSHKDERTRDAAYSLEPKPLLGILIFVVHLPLNAPPIDQLTIYTCDPLPRLPNLGNRTQRYPLNLPCRVGDQRSIRARTPYLPQTTPRQLPV